MEYLTDNLTYEQLLAKILTSGINLLNDGIPCIIDHSVLRIFTNEKEIPSDLQFLEQRKECYYFSNMIYHSLCFFGSRGEILYKKWQITHENKFLKKKILTIKDPNHELPENIIQFEVPAEDHRLIIQTHEIQK